jgi:ectoine hydroxylase-related dioxygenase (phytanoyl-CoA dioxygenase family)
MSVPEVQTMARDPRLLAIAAKWIGEVAVPFRATLFDKSDGSNWLVVWHQDTALPLARRFDAPGWGPWSEKEGLLYAHAPANALGRIIALRVHLDSSLAENGPLRVLPGSHVGGVLTDDEIQGLVRSEMAVDCLVERGGILAMRPLLVHSSPKSRTASPRRVLHLEYSVERTLQPGVELAVA